MSLSIKVTNYEGPFDVLLQLIRKNKMDIYDINIYEITTQYLGYLKEMEQMDMEIASEFILIAATLIEIKSRMLLPRTKDAEAAEENEMDPRKLLVQKLVEYKKYKLVADFFRTRESNAGIMYTKKPEIIDDSLLKDPKLSQLNFSNVTMLDLYNIYLDLMKKFKSKMNTENVINKEIPVDEYRIEDKMEHIKAHLVFKHRMEFTNLIDSCKSKIEMVVTFLALLELAKQRMIKIVQPGNFFEIYLERITDKNETES